jgi:transcriptional regulator with XRE-family HTH domain
LKVEELQIVLGKRIRKRRLEKKFSQEAFADHCGLHRTYMGGIERGEHNLTLHTALTIARGLEISLAELVSEIEKEVRPHPINEKSSGGPGHRKSASPQVRGR